MGRSEPEKEIVENENKNKSEIKVKEFNNTRKQEDNANKIKIKTIETPKSSLKKPEKFLSSIDLKTLSYYSKNIKKFETKKGEKKEPYVVYLNSKIDAIIEKNKKRKLGMRVAIILCSLATVCGVGILGYKLAKAI